MALGINNQKERVAIIITLEEFGGTKLLSLDIQVESSEKTTEHTR